LTAVSAEDEGLYRCEDTSNLDNETIRITSANPGVIPVQQDVVVVENSSLTLSVFSSGDPPPIASGHIWNLNGTTFSENALSNDGKTLTVSSAGIAHNGTYTCTVTIAIAPSFFYLNMTSIDVLVFVPPRFISSPVSGTYDEFSTITLTCSATGNPPPRLQWNRNNDKSTTVYRQHNGLPLSVSTLNITTALYDQAGAYRCTATTSVDGVDDSLQTSTSNTAQVSIHHVLLLRYSVGDGVFIPAGSVIKVPGDGAMVVVQCVGSGNLQWSSPSGEVVSFEASNEVHQEHDPVLTAQILTISSFQLRHNGNYICRSGFVTNLDASIRITLNNPAAFPDSPVVYAVQDSEAELRVTVRGSPLPTSDDITWSFGGSPIESGERHSFRNDKRTLVIRAVEVGDYGSYVCFVNTSAGDDQATVKLLQPSPPTAVISPPTVTVMVGDPVNVTCTGTGSGQLSITWRKDGNIGLPEGVSTTPQGLLMIGPASLDHNGQYLCTVSNVAGDVQDSVNIIVQEEPRVSLSFKGSSQNMILDNDAVSLREGAVVAFICSASGSPEPQLNWQFNDDPILPEGVLTRVTGRDLELYSNALQPAHGGKYSCVARNDVKETLKSFTIEVQSPAGVVTVYPITPVHGSSDASYKVPIGHTSSVLSCIGSGQPRPQVHWEISSALTGHVRSEMGIDSPSRNYVSADLVFDSPFQASDSGRYTCVVSNELSTDSITVTVEGDTSTDNSTNPPVAPPGTSEIHIQLRMLFGNCTELTSSQRRSARTTINEAVYSSIGALCGCEFGINQLSAQSLVCSTEVNGAILYRATLTSTSTVLASTAYITLSSWALRRPIVVVLGVQAQVDVSCTLLADSPTAAECPTEAATSNPLGNLPFDLWVLILLCVIGGALLVFAGIVLFCFCYCFCFHKKGGYRVYGRATDRSESFRGNFPHADNPSVTQPSNTIRSTGNGTVNSNKSEDCSHYYDEPALINPRKASQLDSHVLPIGSSSESSNPPASPHIDNGQYSVLHPEYEDDVYPSPHQLNIPNLYNVSLLSGETSSSFIHLSQIPSTVRSVKGLESSGELTQSINFSQERLRAQANTSSNNSAHSVRTNEGSTTRVQPSDRGSPHPQGTWYHESADNIILPESALSQPVTMQMQSAQPYMEPSPRRSRTSGVGYIGPSQAPPVRRTVSHQVRGSDRPPGNEARRINERPSVHDTSIGMKTALV
jgi:hypothetical protein